MWLIVPKGGLTVSDLLNNDEDMEFIMSPDKEQKSTEEMTSLSMRRFDISIQLSLEDNLKELGVTDIFDGQNADLSALFTEKGIGVSSIKHNARIVVDEYGCEAAATTISDILGVPEEMKDVDLDRPFICVVTSDEGLPLFTGIVYNPSVQ